ncbi:MAG: hypothetical protein LBG94_11160, partial [Treponema sp.]|nr:hypothetical protein [Treponema sp.]
MRRFNLIILLVLIVILTNSFSRYIPADTGQSHSDAIEISDLSFAFQPVPPAVARVPNVSEYDPKDIQLYIKEQCYT